MNWYTESRGVTFLRAGSGPGPRPTCGLGFYYINQKPEPMRAWFLGKAHSPDPKPAHQARPGPAPPAKAQARNVQPKPEPAFYRANQALTFLPSPQ
jgi:hypothetical protein